MRYEIKWWKDWYEADFFDRLQMLKELPAFKELNLTDIQLNTIYGIMEDMAEFMAIKCINKVEYWKKRCKNDINKRKN